MSFKTRPSTYHIGLAPTSRARCRGCKRSVQKGETRVVVTAFVRPGRSTQLVRCCRCLDARFAAAVLAVYGEADRVPADPGVTAAEATRVRNIMASAVSRT